MTPSPPPPPPATQPLQPPPPMGHNIAPSGAFPGSLTPGWNDPPPLPADGANSSSTGRPRLDLRKRVYHPMNGNESNTQQLPPQPPL